MDVAEHRVEDRQRDRHRRLKPDALQLGDAAHQRVGRQPTEDPDERDRGPALQRLEHVADRVPHERANQVQRQPAGAAQELLADRADRRAHHEHQHDVSQTLIALHQHRRDQPPQLAVAERRGVAPQRIERTAAQQTRRGEDRRQSDGDQGQNRESSLADHLGDYSI